MLGELSEYLIKKFIQIFKEFILFNLFFIAGNAAKMQTVMVPAPYITQEMRKEATLVLDSLNDFKPELFGLPPFTE